MKHEFFLDELCTRNNLHKIGINHEDVILIVKEPELYFQGQMRQAPDILILTKDHHWFVIELKGCKSKRQKAIHQIHAGFEFLRSLGIRNVSGKFVIYDHHVGYHYENIHEQLTLL